MKNISINEFTSSQLNDAFNSVKQLDIEDTAFDRGAFGEVYHYQPATGKPAIPSQVIKIFVDDGSGSAERGYVTMTKLVEQIIRLNNVLKHNNDKPLEHVNALYALPQFIFKGSLDGKLVMGYSSNFLADDDWMLFGKIFDENEPAIKDQLRNRFYNLPFQLRLKMAFDLAEGFYYLELLQFIYADLNPRNIFVHQSSGKLCLIDYEGGAVNDNPETYGKPGQWLAPEIQQQLLNSNSAVIKVDLNTDTWAMAIGIHFMLFNFHPLFFLDVIGGDEVNRYLDAHKWPSANKQDGNFRKSLSEIYDWYIKKLDAVIPPSIVDAIAITINEGYRNPGKRLSSKQWMQLLGDLIPKPKILYFDSDKAFSICGTSVLLKWKVEDAEFVSIDQGIGNVQHEGELKVNPNQQMIYTISALGRRDIAHQPVEINMFPMPLIESLKIPMPAFESKLTFSGPGISMPALNFTIRLNPHNLSHTSFSFIKLNNDLVQKIAIPHTVFNYPTIKNVFRMIKVKLNKVK